VFLFVCVCVYARAHTHVCQEVTHLSEDRNFWSDIMKSMAL
jgi:hypothetical protein